MAGVLIETDRRRSRGEICCACGKLLPLPHKSGEKHCADCSPMRRVYLLFQQRGGWVCCFLEKDCKTSIAGQWFRIDPDRVRELQQNFGANRLQEDFNALEYALQLGRGSVWLNLPIAHYQRLKGS